MPVLCAIACGIIGDRLAAVSFSVWWMAAALCAGLTLVSLCMGATRVSACCLIATCVGLGGGWHHWCWSCVADNEIAAWATERGRLVRLTAKVLQPPLILNFNSEESVPWRAPERTVALIECRELVSEHGPTIPVSGKARLSIVGKIEALAVGDLIQVVGQLVRPHEPANPGDFDNQSWLRAQGLHATIAADLPEAVTTTGRERTVSDWLTVSRAAVRRRAEGLINHCLAPRTAAVAQSLLLGSRVELDRDLRRAFAESGTLHVLAISGMNVGLLWSWLWFVCRVLRYSPRTSLIAVLILLPTYALVTDANPPVVRATIVAVVLAVGQLIGRSASQWNSLALAAMLVLAWNPTDLFNTGAQLSFVAVCAILLSTSFLRSYRVALQFDDAPIAVAENSLWRAGLRWLVRVIVEGYLVSLGIWVMTSPLIASQFHLVSPIGFVLNVLLSPLIAVMFWLGYSFLLLGLISPTLFGWLGVPFDLTLGWFLAAVEAAAQDRKSVG